MIVFYPTRSHTRRVAGLALIGLGLLLTGCDLEPHDNLSQPPPSMPVPASVQAAQKQAAQEKTRQAIAAPTEKELGMPVYPNSTVYVDPTGLAIKPDTIGDNTMATLVSIDPMDKVIEFYKNAIVQTDGQGKTNSASVREESENGKRKTVISGNDGDGNVMMAIIHDDNGRTVMELMHTRMKSIPTSVSGTSDPGSSSSTHAGDLPSTMSRGTGGTGRGTAPTSDTSTLPSDTVVRPLSSSPGSSSTESSSGAPASKPRTP